MIDPETLSKILDYPGSFESDDDQSACSRLVESLTPSEQELAACVSYAYWSSDRKTEDVRKRTAMKEAKRHYLGEGRDFDKALERLRQTCSFREVRHSQDAWSLPILSCEDSHYFRNGKSTGFDIALETQRLLEALTRNLWPVTSLSLKPN